MRLDFLLRSNTRKNADFFFQLFFVIFLFSHLQAYAQSTQEFEEVARYETDRTFRDPQKITGTGISLTLGVDGGLVKVVPKNEEIESNKFGPAIFPSLSLNLFTAEYAIEAGMGYFFSRISGSRDIVFDDTQSDNNGTPVASDPGKGTEIHNGSVQTSALAAVFSARKKLGNQFDLGPIAMGLFTGDSSFAILPPENRNAVFAGLTLGFALGSHQEWRLGAKTLIDVNLHERMALLGFFSVNYAISLKKPNTIVRDKRSMIVQEKVNTIAVEKTVEKLLVRENVRFLFEEQVVNFEFDKFTLTPNSRLFLQRLAQFLASKKTLFNSIYIEGHTDNRGTAEYNQLLSEKRALAVKQELAKNGIPPANIQSKGLGFHNPIDPANNEIAWARNRRVEIVFMGVRDPALLREAIDRLKKSALPN